MLARLGFSIITQLQPKLLLIDEVLAVGDVRFKEKCYGVIERFKEKGVTMLLVSHSPYEIRRLCDRAIWIDSHRIKDDGPVGGVLGGYLKAMQS
jgi:lipopolysaccharide transport system ATP-binding protein